MLVISVEVPLTEEEYKVLRTKANHGPKNVASALRVEAGLSPRPYSRVINPGYTEEEYRKIEPSLA